MVKQLIWALLGIAELLPVDHVDKASSILAQITYGMFLVLGGILLINMMIALLSNTYQHVEVNVK